jgi:hypothetical protein
MVVNAQNSSATACQLSLEIDANKVKKTKTFLLPHLVLNDFSLLQPSELRSLSVAV